MKLEQLKQDINSLAVTLKELIKKSKAIKDLPDNINDLEEFQIAGFNDKTKRTEKVKIPNFFKYQDKDEKGKPLGYVGLNENSTIEESQVPNLPISKIDNLEDELASKASQETTYSKTEVDNALVVAMNEVVQVLLNNPDIQINSIQELLNEMQQADNALLNSIAEKVSYTQAQALTQNQKNQAQANIGLFNHNHDDRYLRLVGGIINGVLEALDFKGKWNGNTQKDFYLGTETENQVDSGSLYFVEKLSKNWGDEAYGFRFNLDGDVNVLKLERSAGASKKDIMHVFRNSGDVEFFEDVTAKDFKGNWNGLTLPQVLSRYLGSNTINIDTHNLSENWSALVENTSSKGNVPEQYCHITNLASVGNKGTQIASDYSHDGKFYIRRKSDSRYAPQGKGWQDWEEIVTEKSIKSFEQGTRVLDVYTDTYYAKASNDLNLDQFYTYVIEEGTVKPGDIIEVQVSGRIGNDTTGLYCDDRIGDVPLGLSNFYNGFVNCAFIRNYTIIIVDDTYVKVSQKTTLSTSATGGSSRSSVDVKNSQKISLNNSSIGFSNSDIPLKFQARTEVDDNYQVESIVIKHIKK